MKKSAGFTLVELVLVMAISSLLAVIAFIGQQHLQDQARFDASIDTLIQDNAYAQNYSASNVNVSGSGDSTLGVQAGTGFELDNNHRPNFPLLEIEPIYSKQDTSGQVDMSTLDDTWPPGSAVTTCPASLHPLDRNECVEDFRDVPDTGLHVVKVNGTPTPHVVFYYIHTPAGLRICHDIAVPFWLSVHAACATNGLGGAPMNVELDDGRGFSATVQFDLNSGLAKRL